MNNSTRRKRTIEDFEFIQAKTNGKMQDELGKGAFGSVRLAKDKQTGQKVAIKTIPKHILKEQSSAEYLKREIRLQKKLDHAHIVKLYHSFEDSENVYLVLEYVQNGNLFFYLRKKRKLAENEAFVYFIQTTIGIDYLHKKGIIHRDLKPENILIDAQGNVKICDFGWSAESANQRMTFCGTLDYMSPEMLNNQPHDNRIDIWALGVLLFELLHGNAPFSQPRATKESIIKSIMNAGSTPLQFGPDVSAASKDLLTRLLKANPNQRATIQDIFRHAWVQAQAKELNLTLDDYVYEAGLNETVQTVDESFQITLPQAAPAAPVSKPTFQDLFKSQQVGSNATQQSQEQRPRSKSPVVLTPELQKQKDILLGLAEERTNNFANPSTNSQKTNPSTTPDLKRSIMQGNNSIQKSPDVSPNTKKRIFDEKMGKSQEIINKYSSSQQQMFKSQQTFTDDRDAELKKRLRQEELARQQRLEEQRKQEQEQQRIKWEQEEELRKGMDERMRRQKEMEESARILELEKEKEIERMRWEYEEKAKKQREQEEILRKQREQEEFQRKQREQEEQLRKQREQQEQLRRQKEYEEQLRRQKEYEEELKRKKEQEEALRKQKEDQLRKQREFEEQQRKIQEYEEQQRQIKQQEKEKKLREYEEQQRKLKEQEALKKIKEYEEQQRIQKLREQEETQRKKQQEEQQRIQQEQQMRDFQEQQRKIKEAEEKVRRDYELYQQQLKQQQMQQQKPQRQLREEDLYIPDGHPSYVPQHQKRIQNDDDDDVQELDLKLDQLLQENLNLDGSTLKPMRHEESMTQSKQLEWDVSIISKGQVKQEGGVGSQRRDPTPNREQLQPGKQTGRQASITPPRKTQMDQRPTYIGEYIDDQIDEWDLTDHPQIKLLNQLNQSNRQPKPKKQQSQQLNQSQNQSQLSEQQQAPQQSQAQQKANGMSQQTASAYETAMQQQYQQQKQSQVPKQTSKFSFGEKKAMGYTEEQENEEQQQIESLEESYRQEKQMKQLNRSYSKELNSSSQSLNRSRQNKNGQQLRSHQRQQTQAQQDIQEEEYNEEDLEKLKRSKSTEQMHNNTYDSKLKTFNKYDPDPYADQSVMNSQDIYKPRKTRISERQNRVMPRREMEDMDFFDRLKFAFGCLTRRQQ